MLRHSHPTHTYPASHYDDQMCLKPPFLLWVAILYLSRAVTLPIIMALGHFAGVDEKAITLFRGIWSADALVPSAIAAVMLYSLVRRVSTASPQVRWIWAHGRIVLAVSAVLDIALLAIALIRRGEINDQTIWSLVAAGGDLYFLVYILAARRVRHVFLEFPAPLDSPDPVAPTG
jgi:Protein of unknown function (DUF2919)